MEALLEMKEQKVVRHLGITGHYRPDALMECIHRYPFDTVLMALNAADPHHYSFNNELLPLAVEKQMGIIGMKIPGPRPSPIHVDSATAGRAKEVLGWHGVGADAGHPQHARGRVLCLVAPQ